MPQYIPFFVLFFAGCHDAVVVANKMYRAELLIFYEAQHYMSYYYHYTHNEQFGHTPNS